jgi:hypothetical protein
MTRALAKCARLHPELTRTCTRPAHASGDPKPVRKITRHDDERVPCTKHVPKPVRKITRHDERVPCEPSTFYTSTIHCVHV